MCVYVVCVYVVCVFTAEWRSSSEQWRQWASGLSQQLYQAQRAMQQAGVSLGDLQAELMVTIATVQQQVGGVAGRASRGLRSGGGGGARLTSAGTPATTRSPAIARRNGGGVGGGGDGGGGGGGAGGSFGFFGAWGEVQVQEGASDELEEVGLHHILPQGSTAPVLVHTMSYY